MYSHTVCLTAAVRERLPLRPGSVASTASSTVRLSPGRVREVRVMGMRALPVTAGV